MLENIFDKFTIFYVINFIYLCTNQKLNSKKLLRGIFKTELKNKYSNSEIRNEISESFYYILSNQLNHSFIKNAKTNS